MNEFPFDIEAELRRLEPVTPSQQFHQRFESRLRQAPNNAIGRLPARVALASTALATGLVVIAFWRVPQPPRIMPAHAPRTDVVSVQELQRLPSELAYRPRIAISIDEFDRLLDEQADPDACDRCGNCSDAVVDG